MEIPIFAKIIQNLLHIWFYRSIKELACLFEDFIKNLLEHLKVSLGLDNTTQRFFCTKLID